MTDPDEVILGTCDYCGFTGPQEVDYAFVEGTVITDVDPYGSEINRDYTEHVICYLCYYESAQDI